MSYIGSLKKVVSIDILIFLTLVGPSSRSGNPIPPVDVYSGFDRNSSEIELFVVKTWFLNDGRQTTIVVFESDFCNIKPYLYSQDAFGTDHGSFYVYKFRRR